MRNVLPTWTCTGILIVALSSIGATQLAFASEDGADADGVSSVVVREPAIESVGINAVPDDAETRIADDVRAKVGSRADLLTSCYARHAAGHSDPEAVVHVDWTITTSGEAVDFTVFTSMNSLEPCIRRTLSDLQFAHVEDRHPRARVQLRFQ